MSRPTQLAFIVTVGAAAAYASAMVSSLQETMSVALLLTDNDVALLQGPALYLPPLLVAVPLGLLIDRYSRSRLLSIFAALQIAGSVLTALAPNFATLILARIVVGTAVVAISMNVCTLAASLAESERRGRMIMMVSMAQCVGMSLAFWGGGKLASFYGVGEDQWRVAMLWLTVPLVLGFALTFLVRDSSKQVNVIRAEVAPLTASIARLWSYRTMLLPLMVGPILLGLGDQAAIVWSAPILSRNFGLSPDRVGVIVAMILLAGGLLGTFLGGLVTDYCQRTGGPHRAMALLIVLAVLHGIAGLFGVMPSAFSLGAMLFAFLTVNYMKGLVSTTITTVVMPDNLRGSSFGVRILFSSMFTSASPLMVSSLSGAIGGSTKIGEALSIVCVITSLVGTIVLLRGRRYFPTESAECEVDAELGRRHTRFPPSAAVQIGDVVGPA